MAFIAIKDEPVSASAGVRARPLVRTERESDGADLEAAIVASGLSYRDVGRAIGADESLVRHIRDGLSTLSWAKIKRLPKSVKHAMLAAEMARDEDETPRSVAPLLVQATRATESSTRLSMTIVEAAEDSVFDERELDEIERDAARGERLHLLVRLSAHALRKAAR